MSTPLSLRSVLSLASSAGLLATPSALAATSALALQTSSIAAAEPMQTKALHAQPELIAPQSGLIAGQLNTIAITFVMKDKWHVYWPGQNETGMPPEGKLTATIDGQSAEGLEFGEWKWPTPYRHVLPGDILDYVYHQRLTIPLTVSPPESAAGKSLTIEADLRWLVCDEACVLEHSAIKLTLPVISSSQADSLKPGPNKRHIDEALLKVPKPISKLVEGRSDKPPSIKLEGDTVVIQVPGAKQLAFLPLAEGVRVSNALKAGEVESDTIRIELDRSDDPDKANLRGVLQVLWGPHTVVQSYEIDASNEQMTAGKFGPPTPQAPSSAQPGKPG